MNVVDLRDRLPFVGDIYGLADKSSLTWHWNGGYVTYDKNGDGVITDDDAIAQAIEDANLHISNGWGGISYHGMIGPTGTYFICRDPRAILAAVADAEGNAHSFMVQVMTGRTETFIQEPTPEMWATMSEIALHHVTEWPQKGHRDWSATQCPGDPIYAWIQRKGWEESMPLTDDDLAKIRAIVKEEAARVSGETVGALNAGFNLVLPTIGRRLIRSIKGMVRDPFGDVKPDGTVQPFPDDNQPIT